MVIVKIPKFDDNKQNTGFKVNNLQNKRLKKCYHKGYVI